MARAPLRVSDAATLRTAVSSLLNDDVVLIENDVLLSSDNGGTWDLFNLALSKDNVLVVGQGKRPVLTTRAVNWAGSSSSSLFNVTGRKVRIVNLEFRGGYEEVAEVEAGAQNRSGFTIQSNGRATFDDCSFTGWPHSAIRVNSGSNARVTSSSFRKCQAEERGYGVSVYNGKATVRFCTFTQFRHAIAGGMASPRTRYVAEHNIILATNRLDDGIPSTVFDVHGDTSHSNMQQDRYINFGEVPFEINTAFSSDPALTGEPLAISFAFATTPS